MHNCQLPATCSTLSDSVSTATAPKAKRSVTNQRLHRQRRRKGVESSILPIKYKAFSLGDDIGSVETALHVPPVRISSALYLYRIWRFQTSANSEYLVSFSFFCVCVWVVAYTWSNGSCACRGGVRETFSRMERRTFRD